MNWQNYHSYRVFGEFVQRLAVERRSYITVGNEELNFASAFDEIKARFVEAFDASDATFDDKARKQFQGASRNTKLVFANLEYLWCMPVGNISDGKKREYALRWFLDHEVVSGGRYFFVGDHGVANPGMWHKTNKYYEMLSLCRVFKNVTEDPFIRSGEQATKKIEALVHEAIYGTLDPKADFHTANKCSMYHLLLHLTAPDRYEAIVSENHKERIVGVFEHVIAGEALPDREAKIRRIREKLTTAHEPAADADRKRRWFFYLESVMPLWIDKKTAKSQRAASVVAQIIEEETAGELEGDRADVSGSRLLRSAKLVLQAKERDQFTCVACRFHYHDQIVQAHHLDPLSEREQPKKTKVDDLITLCPNCHYIAHYLLRKSERFKQRSELLEGLKKSK